MIRIEDIVFEYPPAEEGEKAVRALDGVSLHIKEGSFTAVLGRNGSGKSTLSKQMNALLIPDEGDVFVCGMNTRDENLVWEIRSRGGHGVSESRQSAGVSHRRGRCGFRTGKSRCSCG